MCENQIDPDISHWILEFLLHQPIQNHTLNSLLQVLHIPPKNPIISKLILLHKIQFNVSNNNISEKILELFDIILELDNCLGIQECPDSLKKAYCAVAVECTVRCLRKGCNDVKCEFFDVVKRVWRGRVGGMEGGNVVGLVSEELLEWKDDFEAAVWEESVCLKVVERGKEIDGVEAVRVYVEEEKSRMGPSFLELVSKTLKMEGSGVLGGVSRKRKGVELGRCKKVANKRSRRATGGTSRGAKIVDVDELGAGGSCNEHMMGSPEVEKEEEALGLSRLGVRATVEDPRPEALLGAESVISISVIANKDLEPLRDQNVELAGGRDRGKSLEDNVEKAKSGEGNVGVEKMDFEPPGDENRAKSSGVDNTVNVLSGEANAGKGNCCGQSNAPKSLIKQNKTARNHSNDSSSLEPSDPSGRSNLPSLRGRRVSPPNIYKIQKQPRTRRTWSPDEEESLRTGVEKFGKGNWQLILYAYRGIFVERTTVDLKDKWRNMTKYG